MNKTKVFGKTFTSLKDTSTGFKPVKVVVAMSGGVDSTVAAMLMVKRGYDVTGVFLKCWSETKDIHGQCNWVAEKESARNACLKLKIPLIVIDAEKEYRKYVVEEMFKDYKKGITPNPDVLCNEVVKFPFLLKITKKLKADYLVTGHYVRIKKTKNSFELLRGKNELKDQSYFLYRLREADLKKLLFPIGDYDKEDVREIARKEGFLNYDKKSTVGICFIGKISMKDFLMTKIPQKKGKIVDPEGNLLGEHDGVAYFTIGQRIGPRNGINIKKNDEDRQNLSRWYVAKKNVKKNELIVAPAGHSILFRKNILLKNFHLINGGVSEMKKDIHKVHARIRHVGELVPSKLFFKNKKWNLELGQKLDGVSDGQAVVLYNGEKVLGGGEIYS